MLHGLLAFIYVFCIIAPPAATRAGAYVPVRVAVIGFSGLRAVETALVERLAVSENVELIERAQFQPALSGIGYDGSINMTTGEARGLGAAIGCDFFITGKAEVVTRSERKEQAHEEAMVGVMIVDGRSGALALFDFIAETAQTKPAAISQALKTIGLRAPSYVERMAAFREARQSLEPGRPPGAGEDRIEEIPEEGSSLARGFKPPEFLNRVKPEYTLEAERADISATVEASAVLRASGEVGEVEITRWGGFGLDDSAVRAIRGLRFNPATRDGRPVSVRAIIRYNFRRVSEGT